jgi:tetratricopeptide (TPR) repeat protein
LEVADALWLASVADLVGRERASPAASGAGVGPESVAFPLPTAGPTAAAEDLAAAPTPATPTGADPATTAAVQPMAGIAAAAAAPVALSADILRSLRPLKRRVPSRRPGDVVFDADSTAERAAETGLWLPVTRPATRRWLDLTLVVDCGPSWAFWQQTITAFIAVLQQLGAFRTMQLRLLDTNAPDGPVLRGGTPAAPGRGPAELLDPSGRRVLLVVTDGVAQPWRAGLVHPLLARWGAVMPVAVVHLLPQRLWGRTGLAVHRARLTVPAALRPNRSWGVELADDWLEPEPAPASLPVPVLELDARWLGWWARLITAGPATPADATVLLAGNPPRTMRAAPGAVPSARERVRRFHSHASPPAFRLATLLAAVPVSLPVARLVQAELVPESGPDHLAEVLISGLLQPHPVPAADPAAVTFEIPDGVRAVLLSGARRSDTARVVRVAAERFGDRIAGLTRMRDALDDPDGTPEPVATADSAAEVAIERAVMRALSGPYLVRGESHPTVSACSALVDQPVRNDLLASGTPSAPTKREATRPSASDPMPDRVELADAPGTRPSTPPVTGEPIGGGHYAAARPIPLSGGALTRPRKAGVPQIWGTVPPRNPNFTGRQDLLDKLSQRLTGGSTTAVLPAALHGMGGIGKTQMAVEYIYRHLEDYDLVWWVHATQVNQIRSALTELAQQLGLPGGNEANTAVPAVREALRLGQPYDRWLLVFDAAESPDVVRPFFPTNGPGEILITSRNPDWASVASPLEVNVFKRAESVELLRRRGPEIDHREANQVAERLGDLPLAIEQAAAWRAETGMPVQEYLRLFQEKVTEILDTTAPADYEVSVAAAWNVSFDALSQHNPAAHQLLQVCAFYAPEPISRNLFTGVRGVSISPELDRALRDPMQLGRAIRDINRYGLAKIDHRSNTLLLHRLVQLILRNRMPASVKAVMGHGAHLLLANLDPGQPAKSDQWPRYLDILPHMYASDLLECDDGWARQLAINLMFFLYHYGDHAEALRLAQAAYAEWTERLGDDDPHTLAAAERYGFYLWELGRYPEASTLNQRTLELRRRVSGENAEETLYAQIAVSTDLRASGDFPGAKRLTEDILRRAMGLFGPEDPTTLFAAHIHAISLRFTGEYLAALTLDEDTHRRRVEVLGYEHAHTLNTYTAILIDRREAGDYSGARAEFERHADLLTRLFGEDKAATLRLYSYLAVGRRKDGDHAGALELSSRMLERFRTRYGEGHPAVMLASVSHSIDVRQVGDLPGARKLGEQAFDRYRRQLGERHPHTLAASLDLALTLRLLGDAAASRQLDERVLEQFRASLGPDHPYSVVAAINLASDVAAVGETEAAHRLGTEAADRSARALGVEHPTTLAASLNLALDLRVLGRREEAESRHAEAVSGYQRALGESHPATIGAVKGVRANCDIDPLPF